MKRAAPRIDLSKFITYRLSVLSGAWGVASERFYRKRFGLALREWRALAVLSGLDRRGEGAPASEVVRLTSVEKGGVSRALACLEQRGLVTRSWSDQDGRRANVRLTASGRALLRRLTPEALGRQATLASALTPSERKTFFELLEKIEKRVAELAGDSGR